MRRASLPPRPRTGSRTCSPSQRSIPRSRRVSCRIDDTLSITRLGDSTALISVPPSPVGEDSYLILAQPGLGGTSAGLRPYPSVSGSVSPHSLSAEHPGAQRPPPETAPNPGTRSNARDSLRNSSRASPSGSGFHRVSMHKWLSYNGLHNATIGWQ